MPGAPPRSRRRPPRRRPRGLRDNPVGRSLSVWWPTLMPSTAVRPDFARAGVWPATAIDKPARHTSAERNISSAYDIASIPSPGTSPEIAVPATEAAADAT